MLYNILLTIHIAAGSAALLGAAGAVITKTVTDHHRWHIISGNAFYYGMLMVFITSIWMTMLRPNTFLMLIALFSFYLVWSGRRMAVNRAGKPTQYDIMVHTIMGSVGLMMTGWGGVQHATGSGTGVILMVFGLICMGMGVSGIRRYRRPAIKGKERIAAHMSGMMGGVIAAVTAVLVVNIQTDPIWIAWLAPTVVITPFTIWMGRRIRKSGSVSVSRT